MRDMKIGPRLMAWFAVALFAGLAFGGLAYMKLTATSRVLEPRDGISNSTAFLSEDVRSGIQKEFSLLQQMLVTSDRGELERQMDAFLSERTRQANGFAQLEASISNEKLQTQLGTLKPARDAFGIAADNAVNLIRSGTDAGRQEAFQLEARTSTAGLPAFYGRQRCLCRRKQARVAWRSPGQRRHRSTERVFHLSGMCHRHSASCRAVCY